jgi:dTDP-4-dehydrorhamnose 3,5-epimerase
VRFVPTALPGVLVIEPDVHRDPRGFFLETYHHSKYREGGIDVTFVQHNHSCSSRGTLRGLHAQRARPQAKLIRVLQGEIFDVAVDIRRGSPTFLRWVSVTLSAENFRQCFVPIGFAHGFCVLSESAAVEYNCTDYYTPQDELRILWNDPAIGVVWPIREPLLSDKDRDAPPVAALTGQLPVFQGARA